MGNEKRKVAGLSVGAAIFLTGFKFVVAILTGSLGLLSEALHSGLDLLAAIITYFSVRLSDKPPDREHNWGHGKIENFSALVETILLFVTCLWIIYEAFNRLITGKTEIEVTVWSYLVMIVSIIIDVTRSRALYRVAKKYNSQALEADALHFSTDIWSSSVVILGLVCAHFGLYFADPIAALIVALIVFFISYKLGKRSMDVLLDKAPGDALMKIETILKSFPEIKRYHNIKVRTAGADTFVKVNIHLHPDLQLQAVHEICDRVENEISRSISRCEVFVHPEPEN